MRLRLSLGVALVAGLLMAGCQDDRVAQIQNAVKAGCGVVPMAQDIAIVVGKPEFAGVLQVADYICHQYLAMQDAAKSGGVMTLMRPECIAVVDDVCIRKESGQ